MQRYPNANYPPPNANYPSPNANYPPPNQTTMPVRYMIPNGHRPVAPPFNNMAMDRYATIANGVQSTLPPPVRNPYPPNPMRAPVPPSPRAQTPGNNGEQLQPPQPYYFNPYGNNATPAPDPKAAPPKKGVKEFKDAAFVIQPDGANGDPIRGLVSNNNINDLLKHKGTKVKVSKIYRITKTNNEAQQLDSSDDDIVPLPQAQPTPAPAPAPAPAVQQTRRRSPSSSSSSSSSSRCSTCSSSCSECRSYRRPSSYDDCPECRAERRREQERRQHRRRR